MEPVRNTGGRRLVRSLTTDAGDYKLAGKAITYFNHHPKLLPSLIPQFTPKSTFYFLKQSQFDQTLTLKFLDWAKSHPFFDPYSKCCSLHILTNFKLYKTAQSIAIDLVNQIQRDKLDFNGELVFNYLKDSFFTFNSSSSVFDLMVKSYCSLNMSDKGLNTIRFALKCGYLPSVLAYNCVIDAMIRAGPDPGAGEKVFGEMRAIGVNPNVFTYNILIRGFCGAGELDKGLRFFDEMERIGCLANVVSYNTVMDAYVKVGRVSEAAEVFDVMKEKCVVPNLISFNVLINGFCRTGRMSEARKVFDEMNWKGIKPDEVSFNTLINGFCKDGNVHDALLLHAEMVKNGLSPNVVTYTSLINSMCKARNLNRAMEFLDQMHVRGLKPNEKTYTTLIDGFSQQGLLNEAYRLLNKMVDSGFSPSVITYNALINGHCVVGKVEEALDVIQEMERRSLAPDVVSYTTMISGFCKNRDLDQAFQMKEVMVGRNIRPDAVTYSSLIKGLCEHSRLDEACSLFEEMIWDGLLPDQFTYTTLINAYCVEGDVKQAFHLHDEMIKKGIFPDTVTYSVLINGLNKQARTKEAKRLLLKLFYDDSVPSGITYDTLIESCGNIEFKSVVALLKGFCMKGLMNEADRVVESMLQKDQKPTEAVYNVLIHGHSKSGNVKKAYKLYMEMVRCGFIPHTVTVIALVKALFREEMNEELGAVLEIVLRSCKLTEAELAKVLVHINHKEGNMDAVFNVLTDMSKDGLLPRSGRGSG